ncbi:DUF1870 family protein [Iodobacter sp. CM08]|uniref:DUF1870 family protein n=1 Tax=Iodobacter sp. CM08 TaxID=3085902 RepID=UPI00298194D4|nr:DUF1870 family protein [Iodobacter sp. CM08]MDW5419131.1 DUF1870 family protein [Iodobacter sp. CM08]
MSGAELKTLRESIGLPARWIADMTNMDLRTVQYWEVDKFPIPEIVENLLIELVDAIENKAILMAKNIIANRDPSAPSCKLIRYKSETALWLTDHDLGVRKIPVNCYAIMLARVRCILRNNGINVTIQYDV